MYQKEVHRLRAIGVEDMEAVSSIIRDRHTIARIRAREFMDKVMIERIDLQELFWQFDPMHTGEIPLADFITILRELEMVRRRS